MCLNKNSYECYSGQIYQSYDLQRIFKSPTHIHVIFGCLVSFMQMLKVIYLHILSRFGENKFIKTNVLTTWAGMWGKNQCTSNVEACTVY